LIYKSIIALKSQENIKEKDGAISFLNGEELIGMIAENKREWIKFVLLLLGKYGEERIFGFIISDPTYEDAIKTNSKKELNLSIESDTVKTLNSFKRAFEKTLGEDSSVDDKKYIDLYFDYVFGQIIKS